MPKFKIGDKVKCLHPVVVCSDYKDQVGEVLDVNGLESEGYITIDYDGCWQAAYIKEDGVVLAEEEDDFKNECKVTYKGIDPRITFVSPEMYEAMQEVVSDSANQIESDGGPSNYYGFLPDWKTWNDLADYKAQRQWGEHSFHLGNVGKAVYRWGEKKGTSKEYDARKIVYSGLRVLLMLKGKQHVRTYLERLLSDPQFKD